MRCAPLVCMVLTSIACVRPPAPTPMAPPGTALTSEGARALSHALIADLDRYDMDRVAPRLAPGFHAFRYEFRAPVERERFLTFRPPPGRPLPPAPQREYFDEAVAARGETVVYSGSSSYEKVPSAGDAPVRVEEILTLVWVRSAAPLGETGWRLLWFATAPGGVDRERIRWNGIYRFGGPDNREPNRLLLEVVRGRTPGAALDVSMGQGRNAVYLATQGWRVTGFDISDVGVAQAQAAARAKAVSIDAIVADEADFDYGAARFDLIAFIYGGGPDVAAKATRALRPGGLVVIENFFHDPASGQGLGFGPGELAAAYGPGQGFEIVRDEVVVDVADWGGKPTTLVRFVARKK